jgi:hypothetical protein
MDEKDAAIKRIEEKQAVYKRLFGSEDGVVVMKELEMSCYLKSSLFSKDALEMAYREGMRSMVLHIRSMLDLDMEQFKKLNKEQGEQDDG